MRSVLEKTLGLAAALILFCLICVTCVDVVGRYFFDSPLAGAFELTEVMLAALVFAAFPLATERREHVEVDLLGMKLGPAANRVLSVFSGAFSFALLTTFSWRLFIHAHEIAADGATTNALTIPLSPFVYIAASSALLSGLIALVRGFYPSADAVVENQDSSKAERVVK
ncbi:TRAP transporter small permease [Leucothrix mucor]|uniref:TRAP transporter small permease n=1 Tax=Leucothrix mucor TaxID=45248 RepID=UPI0003B719D2|nr:TRAP transporter small permease [Leucothrix mucor]